MVLCKGGWFFGTIRTVFAPERECVYAAFCIPLLQWVPVHNDIVNIGFFVDKERAEWAVRWQSNKDWPARGICNL